MSNNITLTEIFTSYNRGLIDFEYKGKILFSVGNVVERIGELNFFNKYRRLKIARILTDLDDFGEVYVCISLVKVNQQLYRGKITNVREEIYLENFIKNYKVIENKEEFILEVETKDGYSIQQRKDKSFSLKKNGKECLIEQESDVMLSLAREVKIYKNK